MKSSNFLFRLIVLIILIHPVDKVFSQNKFYLSAGLGVPEYSNIKLKYGQKLQVGACVHYWHFKAGGIFGDYNSWSCAAEILYNFTGKSDYSEQRPWYVLGVIGYYHIDYLIDLPHEQYNVGFYPRIGKILFFTGKAGMNMDLGLFLPLSAQKDYVPFEFRLLYSGSLSFFIRL
jgi:hypothetical protein